MTAEGSSKHTLSAVGICGLFLMAVLVLGSLGGLAWKFFSAVPPPPKALAEARFADGFRVEVVRCELTTKLIHSPVLPAYLKVGGLGGAGTYSAGGLKVSFRRRNGQLSEAGIEHQKKCPALMLLLRAYEPDGRAFMTNRFLVDQGEKLAEIKRDGARFDGIRDGKAPLEPLDLCDLLIEVEDGAKGWLSVDGPFFPDTQDAHALALRTSFPRGSPSLRLRFLRRGQSPVETTVRNPGYVKSGFPPLKPENLPAIRETDEYQVMFDSVSVNVEPDGKLFFDPNCRFKPRNLPKGAFETGYEIQDSQGNTLVYAGRGYRLLPGQTAARLLYRVTPQAEQHPWKKADVAFVAEGTWDSTGKLPEVHLTDEGKKLGFTEITIIPAPAGVKNPFIIAIQLKGKGDKALLAHLHGTLHFPYLAVFDEGDVSIGSTDREGSSHGTMGDRCVWNGTNLWKGPVRPGQVFRLAVTSKPKTQMFEFVFEVAPPQPLSKKGSRGRRLQME